MERVRVGIQWVTVAAAAAWGALPELLQLLLMLMAIDILLGAILAIKNRDFSPQKAFVGVTKKIVSLILIAVAGLFNRHVQELVQIDLVQAASAFYIVPELGSIIRNAAATGVDVFPQLDSIMRYFESASGEKNERDGNPSQPK